jgi:hypothetical protein
LASFCTLVLLFGTVNLGHHDICSADYRTQYFG